MLLKIIVSALGLALAAYLVPGIRIASYPTLFLAALLLGAINTIVRPILFLLTLPLTILTLGLFILILNGAMLVLTAFLLPGFTIDSLMAAVLGWIIVTLFSWLVGIEKQR